METFLLSSKLIKLKPTEFNNFIAIIEYEKYIRYICEADYDENGFTLFCIYSDNDNCVLRIYFINRNGDIFFKRIGMENRDRLKSKILEIISYVRKVYYRAIPFISVINSDNFLVIEEKRT